MKVFAPNRKGDSRQEMIGQYLKWCVIGNLVPGTGYWVLGTGYWVIVGNITEINGNVKKNRLKNRIYRKNAEFIL